MFKNFIPRRHRQSIKNGYTFPFAETYKISFEKLTLEFIIMFSVRIQIEKKLTPISLH
jgi:hypothetical protein